MPQPRLALALALVSLAAAAPLPAADGDWQLVWEDGFDGPSLDWSKWEIEVNAFGGGNHELQLYTDRSENWLLDGEEWQTQSQWDSSGGDYPAPFDHPYHLVLNLAVGGEFLGPPDDTTPFPARFEVDWVKVFQRPPASSTIVR